MNLDLPRFWLHSLGLILLAGLGQFFMAQKDVPWTLWLGLFFLVLAVFVMWRIFPVEEQTDIVVPLSPLVESILFFAILILGLFSRAYGTSQFPLGVFSDRAEVACQALRILHDHWTPGLETLHFHIAEWCVYYLVAGWFWLFGSAPGTYAYFDVTLSMVGLVLTYFTFRQFWSAQVCLLGLFFLAVMRWNFVFAHQIYFQSQTVLFLFLALALLTYALRSQSGVAALVGGAVLAGGLYAYQALKAAPLLILVWMAFEFFREKEGSRPAGKLGFFSGSLLQSLPRRFGPG